jgi:phage terminase large subunit
MKTELILPRNAINAVYSQALTEQARHQIYFGGAGSGKSVFLATRAVLDCMCGRSYLIVREVARTLRTSCYNEVYKAIYRLNLQAYFLIRATDMSFTCTVSGAQILMVGLDDSEKVKSITPQIGVITDIWCEEATQMRRMDVKQLEKRLRGPSAHKKRLHLSFNPVSKGHWIYREYFSGFPDDGKSWRGPDLYILRTTYRDNKFLEPDDREAYENEKDPYMRDVYTNGLWGAIGGAVYHDWKISGEIPKHGSLPLRAGLDFGFAGDPAAALVSMYDKPRKIIYITKELYETGLLNNQLAARIKEMERRIPWTCDSAEPKSIAELRRLGVMARPTKKGPDSIKHGVQWLQQQTIIVHPDCINAADELSNYRFKGDAAGAFTDRMEGPDHLMDALRYAYEMESAELRARTFKRG